MIAGVDENNELFSTWSDLPNQEFKNNNEEIINGVPNLQSMPLNKIHKINNEIYIDSLNIRKLKKNIIKPKELVPLADSIRKWIFNFFKTILFLVAINLSIC